MNNLPILDTEEKLREYLNNIAGCEVDPLTIKAHIFPDRVHLEPNYDLRSYLSQAQTWCETWCETCTYGIVDRAVLPVLKELHARRDREIQEAFQKRREHEARREAEHNCTGSLEQMARKANMTPDRFMDVKRGLEKKLKNPSLLTRILNLFK